MTSTRFSIVIPTYNRAYVLGEALDSVDASSFRDLEVLVVDDGSEDTTSELVGDFADRTDLPVRYIVQENQGKHVALNRAAREARGELLLNVDSDDLLLPTSLGQIDREWAKIDRSERDRYAGIVGNCIREDGALSGVPFPDAPLDSDFLALRRRHALRGEKRWALRREVMRSYPYPVFPGERHSRPGIVINRMSHRYHFRFTNIPILVVRHMADGITANRRTIQTQNPMGYRQYFLEEIRDHWRFSRPQEMSSYYARYVRSSLHAGVGMRRQWNEVPHRGRWLRALAKGGTGYLRDILGRT